MRYPFAIKDVDALCVSHIHSDHLDINTAATVNKNCPEAKFIGPKEVVATWRKWGVPEEKLIVVKPAKSRRGHDQSNGSFRAGYKVHY